MDTQPNQYSNILKALGGVSQATEPAPSAGGLSMAQQAENYSAFSELMKQGIHIPTLLKRLDDMESKVKTLESQPKHDTNAELLAVMEAAVKNNPEVKQARQKVADAKTAIINEMCMKDPRFKDALEEYKTTVNRVYIQTRENDGSERTRCPEVEATDGGTVAPVRYESGRSEAHKEGIQGDEETKEE